jgi:hypothetical protein
VNEGASIEQIQELVRGPDLSWLRDLPRAEAMRIAMIKYSWDAATAAEKVDIGQSRYANETASLRNRYRA